MNITKETMYDKVYGCWLGKNIGGTLGGPIEGHMELMHHTFYTQQFDGSPMENDDLDLQLLNLHVVEQYGINITSRQIAAEWKSHVFFNMDEYALFLSNARRGVETPISGHFNNEFTHCMGSPIRSEIWAVMAAGNPELAAYFAYQDAAVDHAGGEGVYGEVFFSALESMAFEETDPYVLTEKALAFIPADSATARAVSDTVSYSKDGKTDWLTAREYLVRDYGTPNFCYAPLNIAFTILGLLYGTDFSDALLKSLNCGYDTDCTAATIGSILGIMYGGKAIPEKWIKPIGTNIVTCPQVNGFRIPKNIAELTERSIKAQHILTACFENCIDKSMFTIDYDIRTTKFGVPKDCLCEQDLLVTLEYENDHPAIDVNQKKLLNVLIENKMTVPYTGYVYLRSEDGLKTAKKEQFVLAPGEVFCYHGYVINDANYRDTYPMQIIIERYLSDLFWAAEHMDFALCPTSNWMISSTNHPDEVRLASPDDSIDFSILKDNAPDTVYTAKTRIFLPTKRKLRYMVHTAYPISMELDGKTCIQRTATDPSDPYLPAYHRPCPDAKLDTAAGWHTVTVRVTHTSRPEPFEVAYQMADLTPLFPPRESLLRDLMIQINI